MLTHPFSSFPEVTVGYLSFRVIGLWNSGRLVALQSSYPLSARIFNFIERWIHPGLVQTCLIIKKLTTSWGSTFTTGQLWSFEVHFLNFFFFGHIIWYVRSPFPDQVLNPGNGSKSPESSPLDHQGTPWSSSYTKDRFCPLGPSLVVPSSVLEAGSPVPRKTFSAMPTLCWSGMHPPNSLTHSSNDPTFRGFFQPGTHRCPL